MRRTWLAVLAATGLALAPAVPAGYEDNVVAWPSVEPADDYTAASLFAFALGAAGLG
jgi:hypothetical protein